MKLYAIILFYLLSFSTLFGQKNSYVILISFDGFRWDYSLRGITPNLDSMKAEGVHAISLRPTFPSKTFPNHYAIITGMYNDHHGIISNYFENPFTNDTYRMGDTAAVRSSKWYLGEAFWETAERNNIKTASYFWPGSEINEKNRRPSYVYNYDHSRPYKQRIDGVMDWLKLPYAERPHFITLYFHDTDTYGHRYGPNSPEINESIKRLDSLVNYLYSEIENTCLQDSIDVIIVSDHGMTEVNILQSTNIDEILTGLDYRMQGDLAFLMIEPKKNNYDEVYKRLKADQNHYKVYKKEELLEFYHYKDHPFISSLILIADLGWSLTNNDWVTKSKNNYSKGNHGYSKDELDMHGTFIAQGPHFKTNMKTGTLWNIDIYPLLCQIFNISPRANIDGSLDRIEFILKERLNE